MSEDQPQKEDPTKYPPHMQGDVRIRNQNIDAGKPLCEPCGGTGNELFSMYRKCASCDGTGVLNKDSEKS